MTFLTRELLTLIGIYCFVAARFTAQGATVVLLPSKDNTLYESDVGSLSNGAGDSFYVGKTGLNDGLHLRRGLIAFDLSSIPTGAAVETVSLSLFVARTGPSAAGTTISLHLALSDWGEGSSNGGGAGVPATNGDATWLHNFYTASFWRTPGGDFRAAASASTVVTTSNQRFTWTGESLNNDVQGWVNEPSSSFGWVIRGAESMNESAIRINSGESTSNLPQLTVIYTIPEVSSAALLAAGILLDSCRRRRTSVRGLSLAG